MSDPIKPPEPRILVPNWLPVRDAIDHAYRELGREMPRDGIPQPDWNLGALVYRYTLDNSPHVFTKCSGCGCKLEHFQAYRCFDCKAALCFACAPEHFGPKHQERADAAHPRR